jgi:hypothetical protein
MRKLLLVVTLIAANLGTGFAQQRSNAGKTKSVIVAFFDEERLRSAIDGQARWEGFEFFLSRIQEIAKRDFPDVEFRTLGRGELLRLSDGTGLNVQNIQPVLGYVLSAPGKKHRVLSGVQSDADFACAAAAFFRRSSSSCPK